MACDPVRQAFVQQSAKCRLSRKPLCFFDKIIFKYNRGSHVCSSVIPKSYNKYGPYCYAIRARPGRSEKNQPLAPRIRLGPLTSGTMQLRREDILGFARGAHVDFENT